MKPMFTGIKITAVIAVGALALAGCSADMSGGSSGSGEPAEGGTLVVTTAQGAIPQLDPALATLQWERVLYPLLWNGLTEINEKNEVIPGLAESWEHSEDVKSWTFTLRDGVQFTNDRELEPKDIVWNVERTIADDNASIAHNYLAPVEKVEATGDNEVTFTLSEPDAVLPRALTALRIIAPESADDINKNPIGTGPYEMKSFVPEQSLTLVANDGYWGDKVHLEQINFEASHDTSAAVTALRTGDIHVLWNLATADAKPLQSDANIAMVESDESTQLHYLAVDNTSGPFSNVKARQALSYALDRQGVKDVAYSGFGDPANYNELVPQKSWAFDSNGLTDYSFDLDKAAELFAEAGVNEGDSLTWWGIAGSYPEWNKEGQLLQQNLAKIGIKLNIENNEIGTWVDKFVPIGKNYPGYIVPNAGGDLNDPAFINGRLVGGACECNFQSDELDKLAAQGLATADENERAATYQKMNEIISSEVPEVFSMHTSLLTAVRSNVTGAWSSPSGDLHLENAGLSK